MYELTSQSVTISSWASIIVTGVALSTKSSSRRELTPTRGFSNQACRSIDGFEGALVLAKCWAYAIILCCLASPAQTAGIQLLDSDPGLAGVIWYPCAAEPKHVALGSLSVAADLDARIVRRVGRRFAVVKLRTLSRLVRTKMCKPAVIRLRVLAGRGVAGTGLLCLCRA